MPLFGQPIGFTPCLLASRCRVEVAEGGQTKDEDAMVAPHIYAATIEIIQLIDVVSRFLQTWSRDEERLEE